MVKRSKTKVKRQTVKGECEVHPSENSFADFDFETRMIVSGKEKQLGDPEEEK